MLTYVSFISINVLIYFIVFLKGMITRRLISPNEYGIFVQAQLILSYGSYSQLGVHNALNFEIPSLIAKKDNKKLNVVLATSTGYSIVISLLSLTIIPFFLYFNTSFELKYGYVLTTICLAFTLFMGGIQNIYRGYQKYDKLSRNLFITSIVDIVTTFIFTYFWGYYGLYIGPLTSAVVSILISLPDILKIKPKFSISLSFERIRIGFPIFVTGMLWSLFLTLSQSIGVSKLTSEEMGYFSIPVMAYSAVMIVPTLISQIIYPKIIAICATDDTNNKLKNFYVRTMGVYIPVIGLINAVILFFFPLFIMLFLPQYYSGNLSLKILLVSLFFLAPNSINTNILISLKKSKKISINIILSLLLMVVLEIILVDEFRILGLSISLLIVFIIYSSLNMHSVFIQFNMDYTKGVIYLLINFFVYVAPMLIIQMLFSGWTNIIISVMLIISESVYIFIKFRKKLSNG